MAKFTPRNPVEATQWMKHGDHPFVFPAGTDSIFGIPGDPCLRCGNHHSAHGTLLGSYVCPGDWIVETQFPAEPGLMTDRQFTNRYIPLVAPRNQETTDD